MSSSHFTPSLEELELLSQVGEMLAPYRDEIAAGLQKVFESNAVFHEHPFTPEELSQMSVQGAENLVNALLHRQMYSVPEHVRGQGVQFAQHGLGDRTLVDMLSVWQGMCLPLVQAHKDHHKERALTTTAKALSRYASLFTEGYIEASRDRILSAQDDMILALEQSLRENEQWLATTLKSIGDGVITTDTGGLVTFVNPVAEALTGWTQREAVGAPLNAVFYIINEETRERCKNPFEKIMKTGRVVGLANSTVLIAKDGTEKLIADSGAPIRDEEGTILGTVLVFRDITGRRKMEDDITRLKSEKMESISILAGGIAHDFNNILTAILGNITIARMQAVHEEDIHRLLTEAEKASLRAKDLTQQLLTFSKGGAPVKKPASVAELLKDTVEFALSGSKAKCTFFVSDVWTVDIDAGQISQVINNLIINADQAMPAGGTIKMRAENVTISAKDELPLKEGNYVKISITDEGIGIPEGHLQRIFEPYFTTKQKGSGLGLATSYSIIKNHDGLITVESELGTGTTFHVYLPASTEEVAIAEKGAAETVKGKGRILLMDDDESILEVTSEALSYLGYEVETARDGSETLEIYKKARQGKKPFDAVIIDLTIRGKMGGRETVVSLLRIDPSVKAIVSSGYSNDPVMANYREYGFCGVVTKPYTIDELSEALCKVLCGEST
ncbi:MAG: PAS domain S-box protein [Theionarchaea archaeon]|nr:PAS domain S-box protein [Theionarchaea archaeon]